MVISAVNLLLQQRSLDILADFLLRRTVASCLILATLLAMAGCQKGTPSVQHALPKPLTTIEAERLVAVWVKANRTPQPVYWNPSPPLAEVTTREILERLQAQVFQYRGHTGSVDEVECYLIKNGDVYPLSIGFGGSGLTSMCVCDLDGDSKPELAYTYSWGSGIHRTHFALIFASDPHPTKIETTFTFRDFDLELKKTSDRDVTVYAGATRLGKLIVSVNSKGNRTLDVRFEPNLPKRYRAAIW